MLIFPTNKPLVLITMGDPSGVGPEIIARSMASSNIKELAVFVLIGDAGILENELKKNNISGVEIHYPEDDQEGIKVNENAVNIIDPGPDIGECRPGIPTEKGSVKALGSLRTAVDILKNSNSVKNKALVTAPVNKEEIGRIYEGFVGHTEYLKDAFASDMTTMVLVGEHLKVVPATRHVPLRAVSDLLNKDIIMRTIRQVIENAELISGEKEPRIGVCGLNPHCGEGGMIGTEEIEIIGPAVNGIKPVYEYIYGPIPADVAFYKALNGELDIVISMYHDQCLSPFKMLDFDNGVNMTLGLDHVRTSPDHGTAFDIAGKGIASSISMECAIKLAVRAAELK